MNYLAYILTFILILSVLVIAHEWGHFIVARIFGIRVDEFSLGFGPRALRIGKLGDTEYNIRWIPLGGFVRIAGMEVDEAPIIHAADRVSAMRSREPDQQISPVVETFGEPSPEQPEDIGPAAFFAHPVWQRALVIFAGPFMSFALGYLIIFGLTFTMGIQTDPTNKVNTVMSGSTAEKMGLKSGDFIVGIDGKKDSNAYDIVTTIHSSIGKPITLTIDRAGTDIAMTGVPKRTVESDGTVIGTLGFVPYSPIHRVGIVQGFRLANGMTKEWLEGVRSIFVHHNITEIRKNAGGPIFIAQATKQAVDQGGESVPLLMAVISMSLALFNLLPIPILDGGYLLLFFIEAIRRGRRLTFQQQQNFMLAGLAVIGVMLVLVMYNDLARTFHPIGQ